MADEQQTATETPVAAEPQVEATPEPTPNPEPAPEPKPQEPDYRAAYVGLQRTVNKLHARNEDILRQNRDLASAVEAIKTGQSAILRQTLGEDEAKALEAKQAQAIAQSAQLEAARAAEQYIVSQTALFLEVLTEAGVDPNAIDWAKDASNVQEWAQRVGPSVKAAVRQANESRIKKATETVRAKSAKEIEEEAEALAQRRLKAAGVDKIDTAKGAGTTSFIDKIRDMDAGSPEFQRMIELAKSGRLTT